VAMLEMCQILVGSDDVEKEYWLKMTAEQAARSRRVAGPMILLKPWSRLEVG
jgi:hypothetical protein